MPPKKKGKGNKLARMTEDERVRYMQHRAAVEEEARRRKQQLIALFMKNKLKHEESFTRINLAKINQQWRQMLRQIKTQELRQDVETLQRSFDHAVTHKTLIISKMLQDLDNAEDQYSMILHCHTEAVDQLIDLHSIRVTELNNSFVVERELLLSNRDRDRTTIETTFSEANDFLATVVYAGQTDHAAADSVFRRRREVAVDEARDAMLGDIDRVTTRCESQMEQVWHDFSRVISRYHTETEAHRSQYLKLKQKDTASSQELHQCYQRANDLSEAIANLKNELASSSRESILVDLNDEKDKLATYFGGLRAKFQFLVKLDAKVLAEMTQHSNGTIKHLETVVSKGERIMQLAIACGKMETEREKIVPFGIEPTEDAEEWSENKEYDEDLAKEVFPIAQLVNFWRRYNLAYLERSALRLHREVLHEENLQLRAAVKRYLTQVACSPDQRQNEPRPNTMQLRKHLMVIPVGSCDEDKSLPRPVTCIEASTCNAVRHMMRYGRSSAV